MLSTAQLQVHKKPLVLIDTEGYFSTFEPLIARIVREGFAIRSIENFYRLVPTPDAAMEFVRTALDRAPHP